MLRPARPASASSRPTSRSCNWSRDPRALETEGGDRLEQREVLAEHAKIVKLKNVVPPIRFASGVADIPASYVEKLRSGARRDARAQERPAAPRRPLRLPAPVGAAQRDLRRQRGPLARTRRRGRGVPPEGAGASARGDLLRVGGRHPADRAATTRTRAGRGIGAWRSRSGTTRARPRPSSRTSWSPARSSRSRSAGWRRCASSATAKAKRGARA